jgi:hypothetical protein
VEVVCRQILRALLKTLAEIKPESGIVECATKYRKEYIAIMAKDSGCAPAEHGFFTDAYVEWLEARLAVAEENLKDPMDARRHHLESQDDK